MAANIGMSSVASSRWDSQDNAQSQRQFEEKGVKKQRRYSDRIENRATLDNESNNVQANQRRHYLLLIPKESKECIFMMAERIECREAFKMYQVMISKGSDIQSQQKPWIRFK